MKRSSWQRIAIKNVYRGLYDGPHATPKPSDEGPVFLGIKNITEDGKLDLAEIRHIAEKEFPRWTKRVTPKVGDIIFSYEATLHRYAVVPAGFRGCLGRRLALIRPNNAVVDTRFLFYYFFSDDWRRTVASKINIGATVDRIPLIDFPNFPISLPPVPIQRKISAILSAYDDLIENNLRRIKILEEMAQLIYREWFVNFRFPGHEKTKFVNSKLGKIPEGWGVRALSEVAAVNARKIGPRNHPDKIRYIDISSVTPGSVEKIEELSFDDAPGRARRIVEHGDLIWSTVRPNRRSHALILEPPPSLVVSTGFAVISARDVPYTYLYESLTTDAFVSYLTNHATGSAYPAVSAGDFEGALLLVPPADVADAFHSAVEPNFLLREYVRRRNANLRQTRDLLLPRLVSGEVDVEDLDIRIPEEEEVPIAQAV